MDVVVDHRCECGCGLPTRPAQYNNPKWGWIKGQPRRFLPEDEWRAYNTPSRRGLQDG